MLSYLIKKDRTQTLLEEILNASTHGIGALLSLMGLWMLTAASDSTGNFETIISSVLLGISLICMYLASTLYHSFQNAKLKYIFKIADHISIYLLIAASYTPLTLIALPKVWGWSLFGIIWGLAVAGVIFKIFYTGRFEKSSTIIYLLMGWLALIAIKPIIHALPSAALWWLLASGFAYTIGVIFYVSKRLRFSHAAWHMFVLVGSACHFYAVLKYVIPNTH